MSKVPKINWSATAVGLSKVGSPTFVANERVGPLGSTGLRGAARGNGANSDSSAGLFMGRTANRCLLLLRNTD